MAPLATPMQASPPGLQYRDQNGNETSPCDILMRYRVNEGRTQRRTALNKSSQRRSHLPAALSKSSKRRSHPTTALNSSTNHIHTYPRRWWRLYRNRRQSPSACRAVDSEQGKRFAWNTTPAKNNKVRSCSLSLHLWET